MPATSDIVQKLWNLCNILRGDGVTYLQYVTELTYLLFLKMMQETGNEAQLTEGYRFEGNVGKQIRCDLMDKSNLHTILRLPTGIFYAQGVKTNVLYFTQGKKEKGNTQEVWVSDMRANMPQFGKRPQLTRSHFAEFEAAFGDDPLCSSASLAKRQDTGDQGRFRRFTRDWIADRNENLDIAWLRDEDENGGEELPEPSALAQKAMIELEAAIAELQGILAELGEEVVEL